MPFIRAKITNVPIKLPEIVRQYSESINWLLDDKYDEDTIIGFNKITDPKVVEYVLDCVLRFHQGQELAKVPNAISYHDLCLAIQTLELREDLKEKIGVVTVKLPSDLYKKYIDVQELPMGCTHLEYYYEKKPMEYLKLFMIEHAKGLENRDLPKYNGDLDEIMSLATGIKMKPEYIKLMIKVNGGEAQECNNLL